MIDEELEHNQARTYRYQEADRYTLIDNMRRIPFSEYTPEDAYGERAFNTAFELNELGALMTIFIPQDSLLRCLVETAESEDDFTKRSLRRIFLFLDEHPAAVRKWFYVDGFDAVGVDNIHYGKTKTEAGTRLLCARLDPSQFECNVCVMGDDQPGGMDLGIELRYSHDSRWSLFGYVPKDPEMPVGRYILAANVKTTSWPCICGSRAVMNMHMMPLSATIATLQDVNRQKTQA